MNVNRQNFNQNFQPAKSPLPTSAPKPKANHSLPSAIDPNKLAGLDGPSTYRELFSVGHLKGDLIGNAIMNIPMMGFSYAAAYKKGKITANQAVAKYLVETVGFSTWTLASGAASIALAGAAMPAFLLPILAMTAGMVANDLFNRFVGDGLARKLAQAIPEKSVKGAVDFWTDKIAMPFLDKIWSPLKKWFGEHKALAAVAGAALLIKSPLARGLAFPMGEMMALSLPINMATNKILGERQEAFPIEDTAEAVDPEWIKAFKTVRTQLTQQGASPEEATQQAKERFVKIMVDNGAPEADAKALVDQIEKAAQAPQAKATGNELPPGLLMARK